MPTHADIIAKSLAECGVKYAFGLPGGEILAFIDACRRAEIRVLLAGHESSAAWMAQVTGQITGIPGLCLTTLGPGATNLVTGLASAFLDRAPMLAVVAQIPKVSRETVTHQRLDISAVFTPITKRTSEVGTRDTRDLVYECMASATAPRQGPTVLILPSDTANQEYRGSSDTRRTKTAASPGDLSDSVAAFRNKLAVSHRPLILIGLGTPTNAAAEIREFVERLQAPFLVTPKAKGILPEDHPLFLGVASGMAIDRDIVATIRAADLVIGIGFDPVEADSTWFADVNLIAIDSVSMAEGSYRPPQAIGDIRSLVTKFTPTMTEAKPWPTDLLQTRQQVLIRAGKSTREGASPLGVIEGLRAVFPRDGIVTCDVGSHKLLMGQFWRTYEPGTFFMSNGLSGMGFGIPAAIAAQLTEPDRAVMTVVGDGGMMMMTHDLALIRELDLPIIIVVLIDNSLSLIRVAQERRGYPSCGVDFRSPNFSTIAGAFGICGRRAETIVEAQAMVKDSLHHRSPLLLEVPVDLREYYDLV